MSKEEYTPKFKSDVVLEIISKRYTLEEVARRHNLDSKMIMDWKEEFLKNATNIFKEEEKSEVQQEYYRNVIKQLETEKEFLESVLSKGSKNHKK